MRGVNIPQPVGVLRSMRVLLRRLLLVAVVTGAACHRTAADGRRRGARHRRRAALQPFLATACARCYRRSGPFLVEVCGRRRSRSRRSGPRAGTCGALAGLTGSGCARWRSGSCGARGRPGDRIRTATSVRPRSSPRAAPCSGSHSLARFRSPGPTWYLRRSDSCPPQAAEPCRCARRACHS